MKKQALFFLTALFWLSCSVGEKTDSIKPMQSALAKTIIGEWGVFVTVEGGVEMKCNVCPKITFKIDQTALLVLPSGDKGELKWALNNRSLSLTALDASILGRIFQDSSYEITLANESDFIEMQLKRPERNNALILRR